jgi:hypothetical protein
MSKKHHGDRAFDPEEIEEADPVGDHGFEESGFADAADRGPDLRAQEMLDDSIEKRGQPSSIPRTPITSLHPPRRRGQFEAGSAHLHG